MNHAVSIIWSLTQLTKVLFTEEQAQNCSLEQEEEVSGETSGNASRLGGEIMEREVHNVDDSDDSL